MLCFSKLCICVCVRACVQVICKLLPIRQIAGSRWPCGRSCCFTQRPPVSVSLRTFLFGAARHCALLRSALSTLNHSAENILVNSSQSSSLHCSGQEHISIFSPCESRESSQPQACRRSLPPTQDPPRLFLGDTKVQHNILCILYDGGGSECMHVCVCVCIYIERKTNLLKRCTSPPGGGEDFLSCLWTGTRNRSPTSEFWAQLDACAHRRWLMMEEGMDFAQLLLFVKQVTMAEK